MILPKFGPHLKKATLFTAEETFFFGGREIPKGSECKAFTTINFGWITWLHKGVWHFAKDSHP